MNYVRIFFAVVLLSFAMHVVPSYGKDTAREFLSGKTLHNLALIRKTLGDSDPLLVPLQAICLVETRCTSSAPANAGSYGIMQIRIETARYILNNNPSIVPTINSKTASSNAIKHLLETDVIASIRIAKALLVTHMVITKGNIDKAIVAYNVGIANVSGNGSVSRHAYLKMVNQWQAVVRTLNINAKYYNDEPPNGSSPIPSTQES